MACVTNEYAASDGDFFTYFFKKYELGSVIGMRTWGGSTGIEPHQGLVDGATTTPPQFGMYGLDGTWPIEGWGVEPDIVVMNMPKDVVDGKDTQLDFAIAYLLEELANAGAKWDIPETPAFPDKSKPRMSGINR
jgi:tricorn protease